MTLNKTYGFLDSPIGLVMNGGYFTQREYPNSHKTTDRNLAKYGDIVRYWTDLGINNYHYEYPTEAQLKDLMNKTKTKIPAYCYTDKGNKVYGIYYSDVVLTGQKSKFPTGKKLWKYQDVTGLVLANQGLFLPITGHREGNTATVVYRNLGEGSEFFGLYLSSHATAATTTTGLKFGSFAYAYSLPQKQQGCPIRPIYVGPAITGTPPVTDAANFAPFSRIIDANGRKY